MGIPLTASMVFLLTITLVFLFTIAMVFLFTISIIPIKALKTSWKQDWIKSHRKNRSRAL